MLKRLAFLPALAIASVLSHPVMAENHVSTSTVMATVGGTDITLGHMLVARETLPEQYRQLPNEVLFPGILDQLIQQTALQQSFTGDVPARVTLSLENERRSQLAGEAIELILAAAVTDEALQAAYQANIAGVSAGTEYNASHILVETEEEALAVIETLNGGADFAATAREKSTGPSGPGGGVLGWFGAGAMVPDFEAAVVAMEAGAVSAPVQTQFGWHVIKLNETRVGEAPSFEDAKPQLEQELREQAVTSSIEALTAAATIDRSGADAVDPSVLGTVTLD